MCRARFAATTRQENTMESMLAMVALAFSRGLLDAIDNIGASQMTTPAPLTKPAEISAAAVV